MNQSRRVFLVSSMFVALSISKFGPAAAIDSDRPPRVAWSPETYGCRRRFDACRLQLEVDAERGWDGTPRVNP